MARPEARALIACSLDCGKNLREIARIQRQHDYVLLASHVREPPDVGLLGMTITEPPDVGLRIAARNYRVPDKCLLLSQKINARDAYNAMR